jgi:glutamate synthase domain-containing protein 3
VGRGEVTGHAGSGVGETECSGKVRISGAGKVECSGNIGVGGMSSEHEATGRTFKL